MGLLNNILLAVLPVSLIAAAQWAKNNGFGLLNLVPLHWLAAGAITVTLRSLVGYWLHRASHRSQLIWRIHRVHHCDVAVDLSTGFRNHPLEALFVASCLIGASTLCGFAPLPLASYEAVAFTFSVLTHANLSLPSAVEPMARILFVTPDMHHVHHSAERHETDTNFGDVISIWDRLFGTYCSLDRSALDRLRVGLDDAGDSASLLEQLSAPLRPRST
jgi:sterol desaturase/sphingolipid hydroxylase (fatty acid hydroxylase superfamily)